MVFHGGRVFVPVGQSHGHGISQMSLGPVETLRRNGLDETGLSIIFVMSLEGLQNI